jgi:cobyrinic acid a,c-diamide synthase
MTRTVVSSLVNQTTASTTRVVATLRHAMRARVEEFNVRPALIRPIHHRRHRRRRCRSFDAFPSRIVKRRLHALAIYK